MNLKKHICKLCWKKYYESHNKLLGWVWTEKDDQRWEERGRVYCPDKYRLYVPTSSIPPHCPYALEHLTQEDE